MVEHRISTQVDAEHPALAGHFPGNPVVPAVLLLDCVLQALQAWQGGQWQLRRLLAAKFLRPLRPGEPFEILLRMSGSRLDFRCEHEHQLLAEGRCELDGQAPGAPP
jgi:3-hydroxyacyl-[acyl-carrier-protein] dehydratase